MNMLINNLGVSKNNFIDPDSSTVPGLEADINQLFYTLYKLTPEEIKIIEKEQGRKET